MPVKVDLLIIDPQIDFCDPKGNLYVKGAEKDIERVANMLTRISPKINDIHVTLDSHHPVDIAHPIFWKDSKGNHPNPFTIISKDDVKSGKWFTTLPSLQKRALEYVTQLENNGRYPLCIWPPHCLIGSTGHAVHPILFDALTQWEQQAIMTIDYVTKGSNPYTEHYSCFCADVVDPADPSTQINTALIKILMETDIIAVAGEAKDFCVYNSLKDLVGQFNDDAYLKKIVLLEDAMSNVLPSKPEAEQFYEDALKRGMQISNTKDFLN